MRITLLQNEIQGRELQDNFRRLQSALQGDIITGGSWKLFRLTFAADVTGLRIPHGLSFIPEDILVTRQTGSGNIVFRYGLFTDTNLIVDISGTSSADPINVKFLAGRL